ncbi:RHS repeat-associated core domain-containing protein [Pseudomonas japonica]|uniref:RHS repeat-associated core domain-containing protein n=1 Tax=Pseudomonas japonica TaxID=256466 RepID=UPI0015E3F85A|nr:RHS repeat-associated core domain-containing protein [Pseudomonas japonica]MBA1242861.1 RHS repeat-associated core domain-containing protein [Pseudomonas japonica]
MATISSTGTSCSLKGTDWQGSLVNEATSSRALVAGFTPSGYSTHPGHGNTGFVGQPHEPIGLYLLGNGYRAYSPTLMRFIAADDLSPFDRGGLNAYAYCAGDPLNNIDPDGHALFRSLSKLGQRIFGGRKAGDIGHLDDKYALLLGYRDESFKGLNTIKITENAVEEAKRGINFSRAGKFSQDPNFTHKEQLEHIFAKTAKEDIFKDSMEQQTAAIMIGAALGRKNALDVSKIEVQKRIFSEGASAFDKKIARYEKKNPLLPAERKRLKLYEQKLRDNRGAVNLPRIR